MLGWMRQCRRRLLCGSVLGVSACFLSVFVVASCVWRVVRIDLYARCETRPVRYNSMTANESKHIMQQQAVQRSAAAAVVIAVDQRLVR